MTWVTPTYALYIDWDDDGDFEDAGETVTTDLLAARVNRGFSNPLARVALYGTASFVLNNESKAYSPPLAANVLPRRAVKLTMTYDGTPDELFVGYIEGIYPTANTDPVQTVRIECVDDKERLDRFEGPIALLENTTADAIIAAAVAAVYTPDSTDYDAGINRFPFSSDRWDPPEFTVGPLMTGIGLPRKVSAGEKILAACVADWGHFFIAKDGTPTFRNRHTTTLDSTTDLTLDGTMTDLRYQKTTGPLLNHIEITCHPRSVGQTLEILGRISQGDAPHIDAGATETFTLYFRDPSNPALRLGGKGVLAPIAGTDAIATDDPAGEGNDVSTDLSISATIYGDHATVAIENTGAAVVYLQTLQIRGYAVRVREPVTVVAEADDGQRTFPLDAALMGNQIHAQNLADHLLDRYKDPQDEYPGVHFVANTSATLAAAARDLELLWRVELTEPQTGLEDAVGYAYSITHDIQPHNRHDVTIALMPGYDICGTVARWDDAHWDGPEVLIY